jgi:hypothetical protein
VGQGERSKSNIVLVLPEGGGRALPGNLAKLARFRRNSESDVEVERGVRRCTRERMRFCKRPGNSWNYVDVSGRVLKNRLNKINDIAQGPGLYR